MDSQLTILTGAFWTSSLQRIIDNHTLSFSYLVHFIFHSLHSVFKQKPSVKIVNLDYFLVLDKIQKSKKFKNKETVEIRKWIVFVILTKDKVNIWYLTFSDQCCCFSQGTVSNVSGSALYVRITDYDLWFRMSKKYPASYCLQRKLMLISSPQMTPILLNLIIKIFEEKRVHNYFYPPEIYLKVL